MCKSCKHLLVQCPGRLLINVTTVRCLVQDSTWNAEHSYGHYLGPHGFWNTTIPLPPYHEVWARIAQPVGQLAVRLEGLVIEFRWGWNLTHPPSRYWVSLPEEKQPGRAVDHQPRSSAEVKERVDLYFCSLSGSSRRATEWTLPLPRRKADKLTSVCRMSPFVAGLLIINWETSLVLNTTRYEILWYKH
jgi:hypothetical protein